MGNCGSSNEVTEVTQSAKQPSRAPSARQVDVPTTSANADLKNENDSNDLVEENRPPSTNPLWLAKPAEPAELN